MCNGAKEYGSDRSRKMLKNEYLLAKFGVDTEENELSKVACLPPSPLLRAAPIHETTFAKDLRGEKKGSFERKQKVSGES